jgi:phospholipid/cholesterol/gamma-HCH transport system substrate-binding protein
VVAIGYLLLSTGDGGTRYRLLFENGGQLVPGNQVLIGGHPVGTVKSVELAEDSQAEITIEMDEPLHEGVQAVIRSTSLSGIANRYVSITDGPDSGDENELPGDAVITQVDTTSPVDLDQLFDTFRKPARKGLRDVIQGFATSYAGRGQQANQAYRFFNPSLVATDRLFRELTADQRVLTDFLVQGARVTGAIAERRDDLSGLVANTNQALGAVAEENESLDRTLVALPPALRQANTTFVNLRAALDDLDPLVAAAKPATRNLAPFLRRFKRVAKRGIPVFHDLRLAVNRPGRNNDLSAFTGGLVKLRNRASNAIPAVIRGMVCSADDATSCGGAGITPFFRFVRPYMPELTALIASLGQVTAFYDANNHFARVSPITNVFEYSAGNLVPNAPSEKYDDLAFGIFRRCPGTASQAPNQDSSTPFLDGGGIAGDCNPADVIPGPP